jgi:Fe2+ or Zn2+ uptake regulation protein
MTQKRNLKEQILKLFEKEHFLSAEEIEKILADQGQEFNKTSIYRSLDKMVDKGELCQQHFQDKKAVYEVRSEDHIHLFCKVCQRIFVKQKPVGFSFENLAEDLSDSDFKVDHVHLALIGVCKNCLKNKKCLKKIN